MDTVYIEGGSPDFVAFINSQGDKASLEVIEGKFRWVITREDRSKYIARPTEAK